MEQATEHLIKIMELMKEYEARKAKRKEYDREYNKKRYSTDPEYKAKKLERARARRAKQKEALES